jgi:thioredoxin-like negative regulator of GroEL
VTDAHSTAAEQPVFQRGDWLAALLTFGVTLAAYLATLAPTVTLEDSGELITAAAYLGVPHPPGYPSWTVITWLFIKLLGGVTFLGHPNPAWAAAFASAFFGALTCGVLALLISGSGRSMADGRLKIEDLRNGNSSTTANLQSSIFNPQFFAALAGGLALAFSPVLWSQSTIAEVYALNAFFQTTILALLYRWLCRPAQSWPLWLLCFLFGFGITNHQTLLFLGPALALAVLLRDVKLFRDFFLVGAGLALLVFANFWLGQKADALAHLAAGGNAALAAYAQAQQVWYAHAQWVAGPAHAGFWVWTALALVVPLAGLALPNGRKVCLAFLLAGLGLLFYLYLPWASARQPPLNWGYPCTWDGFLAVLTRGQYATIDFANILSARFVAQVGQYLGDLRQQFTLPLALAGLLPFCAWSVLAGGRRVSALTFAAALTCTALVMGLLETWLAWPVFAALNHALAAALVLAAVTGFGLLLLNFVRDWFADLRQPEHNRATRVVALLLLAGVAALIGAVEFALLAKALRHFAAGAAGRGLLAAAAALAPLFVVWLLVQLERSRCALRCELAPQQQRWLLASVAAFLGLSVLFISFQNLDMDIQTQFLGRVQFIQSHSVFALWIGYGLLLACSVLRLRTALLAGAAAVMLVPLTLVYQNYFDPGQLRLVGGAEQNGHDFGWQFGAGALEGMAGLRPTLRPDEPPPDREWPPPLETNAVYFGGTDPGRFVPTYMVFCARVRPDVSVLTQNALVDPLYLAPTRDLYGGRLWLPTSSDVELAKNRHIADVEAGRVRNRGEVIYEQGVPQLFGRAGVLAANGAVARLIFERNKARHAFYIEESEPLEWMYPHLTPHGFILKLNAEPLTALPPELVRKDREFWDWQTRRLCANWRFRHDTVAMRVFHKLRCAIGGVYAKRGMHAEAEYAFRQAMQLYPLGPEAPLRLAEMLVAQHRCDDARRVVLELLKLDDRLRGAHDYLAHINTVQQARTQRDALEQLAASGRPLAVTNAFELAELYDRLGQRTNFLAGVERLLASTNDLALATAQFLLERRHFELAARAFTLHLERHPADVPIRVEFAAFCLYRRQTNAALEQVRTALLRDAAQTQALLRDNPRYSELRALASRLER